jgi:hypothetical protein
MAHLNLPRHSRDLSKILDRLAAKNVPAIMASAERPATGRNRLVPILRFAHACDLIGFIRDGWPQFQFGSRLN